MPVVLRYPNDQYSPFAEAPNMPGPAKATCPPCKLSIAESEEVAFNTDRATANLSRTQRRPGLHRLLPRPTIDPTTGSEGNLRPVRVQ